MGTERASDKKRSEDSIDVHLQAAALEVCALNLQVGKLARTIEMARATLLARDSVSELTQAVSKIVADKADEHSLLEIVSLTTLALRLGVDRTTLWRMRREDHFPKPLQMSSSRRLTRYVWREVLEWYESRRVNSSHY